MAKQASALLIVEKGAEDASVIPLDQDRHIIGKISTADIPLANPYVSRQHAQILLDHGDYRISDLGSKNGTYVNGVRLTSEARVLNSGDRIELGEGQVVLRFQTWTSTLNTPRFRRINGIQGNCNGRTVPRDMGGRRSLGAPPLSQRVRCPGCPVPSGGSGVQQRRDRHSCMVRA